MEFQGRDSDLGDEKMVDSSSDDSEEEMDRLIMKRLEEEEDREYYQELKRAKLDALDNVGWDIAIGYLDSSSIPAVCKEEAFKRMKEHYGSDVVCSDLLDELTQFSGLMNILSVTYPPEEDIYGRLFLGSRCCRTLPLCSIGLQHDKKFLKLFSVLEKADLGIENLLTADKEVQWTKAAEIAEDAGIYYVDDSLIATCVTHIYYEKSLKASFQTRETIANHIVDCYHKKIEPKWSATLGSFLDFECARQDVDNWLCDLNSLSTSEEKKAYIKDKYAHKDRLDISNQYRYLKLKIELAILFGIITPDEGSLN